MNLQDFVLLKWVLPTGISLQDARYRFICSILALLVFSVFAMGVILWIGLDRLKAVEQASQQTLQWRNEADASDAIFQEMYLKQYNDYQILLDAEKLKYSQTKETADGTDEKR